jgi:hypothetical protein
MSKDEDLINNVPKERKKLNFFAHHRTGVLLTQKQVEHLFNVTPTTIFNWRKKSQLPVYHLHAPGLKKPPARFDLGEILQWAQLNQVKVVNPYEAEAKKETDILKMKL